MLRQLKLDANFLYKNIVLYRKLFAYLQLEVHKLRGLTRVDDDNDHKYSRW